MDHVSRLVIMLTAGILLFFGLLVVIWSLAAKAKGKDAKAIWIKYLAWFLIAPPLVIPLVYSRSGFQLVVLFLSILCFREYSRVVGLWKDKKLMAVCYLGIACIYWPIFFHEYGIFQAMPIYVIAFILTIPVQKDIYEHMIQKTCLAVLGVVYFGWFLSHLAYLRNSTQAVGYIFFLLVLVESNDAFAYLWGSLLGKHKLAPNLSPNKTKEGALGAMVSVIVMAFLLRPFLPGITTGHLILLTFSMSLFGMCGDLTISFIKRDLKIKDMGSIIPGHGGLLDRFDSIIFTVPIFFHFMRYFYGQYF